MQDRFDVVIIGSGAGGAPIANRLVLKGKSVLVLEKGPLLRPHYQLPSQRSDFRRDEVYSSGPEKILRVPGVSNIGDSYYSSHVEPDISDEPHIYLGEKFVDGQKKLVDYATIEGYTAQVVGGGTQLYGGVSLRFTPTDMQLKTFNTGRTDLKNDPTGTVQEEARDWPIKYEVFEKYYALAEQLVGLNGTVKNQQKPFTSGDNYQPPLNPNPISKYAHAGMVALGQQLKSNIEPYRTPLAVITRDHDPSGRKIPRNADGNPDPESVKTSYVNRYGDPLGLKSNTWVSLLSPVYGKDNFTIRPNCVATRLVANEAKVTEVHYLDPGGNEQIAYGKVIVVACSAIESVRLLKLSAIGNDNFQSRIDGNGLLGRYFLTHCFGVRGPSCRAGSTSPRRWTLTGLPIAAPLTSSSKPMGCGPEPRFTTTHPINRFPYRCSAPTAAPISTRSGTGSCTTPGCAADGFIEFLDREFGRGLSVSFMANQIPQRDNRIELHPTVTDKWGRPVAYIIKTWHQHDQYLMDLMAKQCANVLRLGIKQFDPTYDTEGEKGGALGFGGVYQSENSLARIANHILGGCGSGNGE